MKVMHVLDADWSVPTTLVLGVLGLKKKEKFKTMVSDFLTLRVGDGKNSQRSVDWANI